MNEDLIGATYLYSAERGKTAYELSNHLGNVLATVSDRRNGVPLAGNSSLIEYYTADVVTANDYYPFGMLMPGRKYSAEGKYRYGFNGKENDNEVKGEGNQQDYGMRIYDPRLGRFLSVDPITKEYPELTPYQFASNRPIDGIDRDGLEHEWYGFGMAQGDAEYRRLASKSGKSTEEIEAASKLMFETTGKSQVLAGSVALGAVGGGAAVARVIVWCMNNPAVVSAAAPFFIGLLDPNPPGAPSADLPGPGDDAGRVAKAATKRLFTSLQPIVERRKELAKAWGVAVNFIEYSKKVFSEEIEEGIKLIQFRTKGTEGTIGNYFALPGTKPESIGIKAEDIVETLTVKVKVATKVLYSTHKKDVPYYKDGTTVLEGGGLQIFSKDLKNNVEILNKTSVTTNGTTAQ